MPAPASATAAFDLIAHPDAIVPPYAFLAVFWAFGVLFIPLFMAIFWRRSGKWKRLRLALFTVCWWGMVLYATWHEVMLVQKARTAIRTGLYQTAEGCLSSFHPGASEASRSTITDEAWTIGSEKFEYGAGTPGFGYHEVEPLGGAVHADSRVSVAFIRDDEYSQNKIIRLTVRPHSCPNAPDPGLP
jgi:hypothetical protein